MPGHRQWRTQKEGPKDGGYLTQEQLKAIVVVINGIILAQAASLLMLKDAHVFHEACKGENEGNDLVAGVHAAQRRSSYIWENAHTLFEQGHRIRLANV